MALAALWVAACAPQVERRPTELTPAAEEAGNVVEVVDTVSVWVGHPGYRRVIRRGSLWTKIGRAAEGEIFKPVGHVFTVEGAHVHEAYLVLNGERVVGFYLPVERAFAPVPFGREVPLSFQRRQP